MKYIYTLVALLLCSFANTLAQTTTLIIPAANTNGANNNNPYGSFYGYERTCAIYTAAELGGMANAGRQITKIGFYVNSLNSPSNTPVIIYLKAVSGTNFPATTNFATQISGATVVYTGTITTAMLSANNWVDIVPTTAFTFNGTSNLEVIVEANATGGGNEGSTGKQFRWSNPGNGNVALTWQADSNPPTTNGTNSANRPNIKLDLFLPLPCGGTPNAGTASAPATACPSQPFNLSLSGQTTGIGISIQWERRVPAGTGTWADIPGATTAPYSLTQAVTTDYRARLTCANGGAFSHSNIITVVQNNFLSCYCTPTYSNGGGSDYIASVRLKNLYNPTTGNAAPYYRDYTLQQPGTLPIPVLYTGYPDTVKLTFGPDGSQYSRVWFDFNQNGVFETTESYSLGTNAGANGTANIPFVTPVNASIGITRMRVRGADDSQPTNAQPCNASSSTYGEAEDYFVDIQFKPLPPSNVAANPNPACERDTVTLSATANNVGGVIVWDGPLGRFAGSPSKINGIVPASAGTYMARVAIGADTSEGVSIQVGIHPAPPLIIAEHDTVCLGDKAEMKINDVSPNVYDWYTAPVGGVLVTTANSIFIPSLTEDSILYVRGRSPQGCITPREEVRAIVGAEPIVSLGPDTTICANKPYTLNAYNEYGSYVWSTGANTPAISVNDNPGKYWVEVDRYCLRSDTVTIGIDYLPDADGIHYFRTQGNTYTFAGLNIRRADSLVWVYGDGSIDTAAMPTHSFTLTVPITVQLVLFNRCGTDTTTWTTATHVGNLYGDDSMVEVYPNPASNQLYIEMAEKAGMLKEVVIINTLGAVVRRQDAKGTALEAIDVSMLPAGQYIIRLNTGNGIINKRFEILR
jgi:hypothetical protein